MIRILHLAVIVIYSQLELTIICHSAGLDIADRGGMLAIISLSPIRTVLA